MGSAYNETYIGDASKLTDKEVADLGFNQSAEHTDIISTKRRTVTATLADGSEKIIYQNGQFTV
ncbi:TPA: hypothetical protein DCZ39_07570 [Patescibacteria group bacterium]|nr:hypothetical protein [Candidatus Gracilibacteria bacterium]